MSARVICEFGPEIVARDRKRHLCSEGSVSYSAPRTWTRPQSSRRRSRRARARTAGSWRPLLASQPLIRRYRCGARPVDEFIHSARTKTPSFLLRADNRIHQAQVARIALPGDSRAACQRTNLISISGRATQSPRTASTVSWAPHAFVSPKCGSAGFASRLSSSRTPYCSSGWPAESKVRRAVGPREHHFLFRRNLFELIHKSVYRINILIKMVEAGPRCSRGDTCLRIRPSKRTCWPAASIAGRPASRSLRICTD